MLKLRTLKNMCYLWLVVTSMAGTANGQSMMMPSPTTMGMPPTGITNTATTNGDPCSQFRHCQQVVFRNAQGQVEKCTLNPESPLTPIGQSCGGMHLSQCVALNVAPPGFSGLPLCVLQQPVANCTHVATSSLGVSNNVGGSLCDPSAVGD